MTGFHTITCPHTFISHLKEKPASSKGCLAEERARADGFFISVVILHSMQRCWGTPVALGDALQDSPSTLTLLLARQPPGADQSQQEGNALRAITAHTQGLQSCSSCASLLLEQTLPTAQGRNCVCFMCICAKGKVCMPARHKKCEMF